MPKKKNVGARRKGRQRLTQQQKMRLGVGLQGQGLATEVAKIIGPIIAKEAATIGAKIIGKKVKKRFGGGRGNRGAGLRLAGQRGPLRGRGLVLAGRGTGKKKRKKLSQKQLQALARGRARRKRTLG